MIGLYEVVPTRRTLWDVTHNLNSADCTVTINGQPANAVFSTSLIAHNSVFIGCCDSTSVALR